MNKVLRSVVIVLLVVVLTISCASSVAEESTCEKVIISSTTPSFTEESIGTVSRERDQVAHAHVNSDLQPLTTNSPLFNYDTLQVTQGGEALLDFRDNLKLNLFNDSELGEIWTKSAPGIPLNASITLERGGFTGCLTQEGSKAVFPTPGGATITVFGTEFFVVYDETSGLTVAGNFEGEMEVSASGSIVQVPSGNFIKIPDGQQPEPLQSPIPFDLSQFVRLSRDMGSPIAVIAYLEPSATQTPTPIPTRTPTLTLTRRSTNTPTLASNGSPTNMPTLTAIVPTPGPEVLYDFVASADNAMWSSPTDKNLSFSGDISFRGYAQWVNGIQEDGSREAKMLHTHPSWQANGWIEGIYSPDDNNIVIQPGDRMVLRVGLLDEAEGGDVTFTITVNYGDNATGCGELGCTKQLFSEYDWFDGKMLDREFPLPESMIGQPVRSFILRVDAGQSSGQDWAVWVIARLERPYKPLTWEFEKENDPQGWEAWNQLSSIQVIGGSLVTQSTGEDPNMASPLFRADSTLLNKLEIRMKVSDGNIAQIFFITDSDSIYDEAKSLRFPIYGDGEFHIYPLDMSKVLKWKGVITQIRLDPVETKAMVEIDYIKLLTP